MKDLIGKVVKEMYVNQDQSLLKFETDQGSFIYEAVGDCCSETWFADIIFGFKFFNGTKVQEVTDLDIPEWLSGYFNKDGRTRQEYDEVYGYRIKTESSRDYRWASDSVVCDVIFRNSSNGYYGGWCELITDVECKWNKKKLEEAEWTEIKEDWQA